MLILNLKKYKINFVDYLKNQTDTWLNWSNIFDKRVKDILSDHHIIAAYLDPKHRSHSLLNYKYTDLDTMLRVTLEKFEFSEEEKLDMYEEFFLYFTYTHPFEEAILDRLTPSMSSSNWWNRYHPGSKLTKLANFLLTIPASAAAVERSFSHENFIFSQRRQRMKPEILNKLLKLKFDHATSKKKNGKEHVIQLKELWAGMGIAEEIEEEHPSLELDGVDSSDRELNELVQVITVDE